MRLGVTLRNLGRLPASEMREYLLGSARTAEEVGLYSAWVSDHLVAPEGARSKYPYHREGKWELSGGVAMWDSLTVLAGIATATSTLRFGISCLVLPLRHPILSAKMLATLDCLSEGRLIVAVGVGWLQEEMEVLGAPTYERRGSLGDEYIEIFKTLWTDDEPSYDGEWWSVGGYEFLPKPVQQPHPPIWVAGTSGPALRRVIRHGDGWHAVALTPDGIREKVARIRELAAGAGRDLDGFDISTTHTVIVDMDATGAGEAEIVPRESGMPVLEGNPEQLARAIKRYGDAGINHFTAYYLMKDETLPIVERSTRAIEIVGREVAPALESL
ncbi:MAG TPA: TIGR03619 family F420-dependent LLM class oxidoreductase [Acidimicrobiia bacterium]|nr:TIGR03619 family F420-dependent LLM class oxidoreductase [Acidimicrobiia bacterium]